MKPSDDMVLLAMLLDAGRHPCADEVRSTLRRFGVEMTAQQVAATLNRLSREETPTIQASPMHGTSRIKVYELTRFGRTQLSNHWPRLRPTIRGMSSTRPAEMSVERNATGEK